MSKVQFDDDHDAAHADDGMSHREVPELTDAVSGQDDEIVDAEPMAKKSRKGINPRVMVLVIGVLVIGVVGLLFVPKLLGLGAAPAVDYSASPQPAAPIVEPAQPAVGLLPSGAGGAGAGGPGETMAQAAPAGSPEAMAAEAALMAASATQMAQAATGAGVEARPLEGLGAPPVMVMAAPASPGGVSQVVVDQLDSRLAQVERRMAEAERSAQRAMSAKSAQASIRASSVAGDAKAIRAPRRTADAGAADKKAAAAATAPVEVVQPQAMAGLQLRAVYPPVGPDMQAWVIEGDAVRVVSRGSVIGGARVVEVKAGLVVTDRGVIR